MIYSRMPSLRKRSKFNFGHTHLTSCKMGYIVPIMMQECLPGDTWQGDTKLFLRMAPLVAPVMHRLNITVATFYVPLRLIWDDSQDFLTGGPNGTDDSVPPTVSIAPTVGSLADHFGLPITENNITVSALPFRAMALIWNDRYRDQDLQDPIEFSTESGPDETTPTDLLRASWGKDYFTTARPSPQKGPNLVLPIGESAPLSYVSTSGTSFSDAYVYKTSDSAGYPNYGTDGNITGVPAGTYKYQVDLSGVTGVDINTLREYLALQVMQERRSLFGSRYEDLLHYWNLPTQDSRLQLPELISNHNSLVQFSEVLQTSQSLIGTEPGVGAMAGHGVGASRSGRWRYFCYEHGYIMTFLIVRPQAVYTQGIERMWTRRTRMDYWNPEFQHIGQRPVLSKEVYADGTDDDEEIFGYQNQYDEYRRAKNYVSGEFKTTLNYWHMARQFENRPSLNGEFIESNPTDRIFQLSETLGDQLYVMVNNDIVVKRLVDRQGNPM